MIFDEYYNNFTVSNLTLNGTLVEIIDHHNIYPILTTENRLYTGIPPKPKEYDINFFEVFIFIYY
jgi:hypothetical protein